MRSKPDVSLPAAGSGGRDFFSTIFRLVRRPKAAPGPDTQPNASDTRQVWNACMVNCGSRCALRVHVRDGRITRIETDHTGDDQYGSHQIRACLRGRAMRKRVYAPGRLKYPLKRVGNRGTGSFERIGWDEALDIIAARMTQTKSRYGNEAFYLNYGTGSLGSVMSKSWPPAASPIALVVAFVHLARPAGALFAILNLRTSWLSREVVLAGFLTVGVWGLVLVRNEGYEAVAAAGVLPAVAVVCGFALIYCMARLYMLRTVPAWDRMATPVGFLTTAVLLGGLLFGLLIPKTFEVHSWQQMPAVNLLTLVAMVLALAMATLDLAGRRREMANLRRWIVVRSTLQYAGVVSALLLYPQSPYGSRLVAFAMLAAAEVSGRYLFYARYKRVGF